MRSLTSAISWVILCLMVHVCVASAQEPGRVYRVAWMWLGRPGWVAPPLEKWTGPPAAFRDALQERSYVGGKNLIIDIRSAEGDASRYPALAEVLVATRPDVLITVGGTAPLAAAMRATRTIPIVFFNAGNVVERGIVKGLVDHDPNVTGMNSQQSYAKTWQLLRNAAPTVRRIGFVAYAPNAWAYNNTPDNRAARMAKIASDAASVGLEVVDLFVDSLDELEPKIDALAGGGDAALFLSADPVLHSWSTRIMEMAMRHRLPTTCSENWGAAGCVISYHPDTHEIFRHAAAQVAKILSGTKAADIPIGQSMKFKLTINLKTAKALDLTVPTPLFALADEVID
ncbi:ABC transporter substrate-binding protein [Reyranella sp.]|uniref:ABC transporter substrate-binding protein n=1 Tax=Reyranella sp. TaxID=1929291 RepID=UPI003784F8DD